MNWIMAVILAALFVGAAQTPPIETGGQMPYIYGQCVQNRHVDDICLGA